MKKFKLFQGLLPFFCPQKKASLPPETPAGSIEEHIKELAPPACEKHEESACPDAPVSAKTDPQKRGSIGPAFFVFCLIFAGAAAICFLSAPDAWAEPTTEAENEIFRIIMKTLDIVVDFFGKLLDELSRFIRETFFGEPPVQE